MCTLIDVVALRIAYVQGQYVVLFFYPLDFTFVCPTEITAFSDKHDQFKKLNAEVTDSPLQDWSDCGFCTVLTCFSVRNNMLFLQILGISVDSQFSHLAWCQTGIAKTPCSGEAWQAHGQYLYSEKCVIPQTGKKEVLET